MSKYRITINGNVYEMEIEKIEENKVQSINFSPPNYSDSRKATPVVQLIDPVAEKKTVYSNSVVYSPMPGTVVKVLSKQGDKVKCGQPILVLEAMKMENEITSPKDGILKELFVSEGQTVVGKAMLFEIGE